MTPHPLDFQLAFLSARQFNRLPANILELYDGLITQYGEPVVIIGIILSGSLLIITGYLFYLTARKTSQITRSLVGRSSPSLETIDQETFEMALAILQTAGETPTQERLKEKATQLNQLEALDEKDIRIGIVQDHNERSRADQAIIAPTRIEEGPTHLERNAGFARILTISALPDRVPVGWLTALFTTNVNVRVSYHITPRDTATIVTNLQTRLTQIKASLVRKYQKNRTDTFEEEAEERAVEQLMTRIVEGRTKLFDFAIYLEIIADSIEELDILTRDVINLLAERNTELVPIAMRQIEGQQSTAPIAVDPIKNTQLMQEDALATTFGFIEPAINNPDGVLFGFDDTGMPVMVDQFSLSGYCMAVSGKIGSGKTYFTKMKLWRRLQIDPEIECIMFDPLGDDFVDFVTQLDGQVIKFGGDYVINPLELNPIATDAVEDPYRKKIRSLIGMMRTHFTPIGGLSAQEEGLLVRAFHLAYLKYGITPSIDTHDAPDPTMQDVLDILTAIADGDAPSEFLQIDDTVTVDTELNQFITELEDRLRDDQRMHAENLLLGLEDFQANGINANLNGETNVSLDNRIVCFDMSMFADTQTAPLLMHVMLEWVYQRAQSSSRRTEVTFEEVHYLLGQDGARELLNLFIRHSRHFNTGLTLISQTVDEFVATPKVREIYDQCDIRALFYLEHVSNEATDYFDLSPREIDYIEQAARGQDSTYSECLLAVTGYGRRRLEIRTGDFEQHVLDDKQDPWEYLLKYGDMTPDDVQYLHEHHLLEQYSIPQDLQDAAGV